MSSCSAGICATYVWARGPQSVHESLDTVACRSVSARRAVWRSLARPVTSPGAVGHGRFVRRVRSARLGRHGTADSVCWCYHSGHVYDDIAPKLSDRFHVFAVTRRGVGASDRPATGYDPERRAADILERSARRHGEADFDRNWCGGGILHTLGAQHPDRLSGLVYLDAAEAPTLKLSDYGFVAVAQANLPKRRGEPQRVVFPEARESNSPNTLSILPFARLLSKTTTSSRRMIASGWYGSWPQ